jgi:para-nitrobenzyl esterase
MSSKSVALSRVLLLALGVTCCAASGACGGETPPTAAAPASAPASEASPVLEGTAWRLVAIRSMDDSVYEPDDRDRYTIEFGAEGRLAVRADCNRGSGGWTREDSSGLRLGPLAMTRAMCPPGSLHDRFVRDLDAVRSFVERDGHIHLATFADGAILEFEPLGPDVR